MVGITNKAVINKSNKTFQELILFNALTDFREGKITVGFVIKLILKTLIKFSKYLTKDFKFIQEKLNDCKKTEENIEMSDINTQELGPINIEDNINQSISKSN